MQANYGDFREPTLDEEFASRMDAADRAARAEDRSAALDTAEMRASGHPAAQPDDYQDPALTAAILADDSDTIRPVFGEPEATTAEPCDEYCEPDCVHHVANVGWDLSFGSRINIGPRSTTDPRLIMSLHLSDDAIANGMVYREVTPQKVIAYAQQLLELTGAQWQLVPAAPREPGRG